MLHRPPFPAPYQSAFELKFVKKKDAAQLDEKIAGGRKQLQSNLAHDYLRELADLRAWLMVLLGTDVAHLEEVKIDRFASV